MAKINQNSVSVRKTLVMWSAGLDSTYGLVRLLASTDDDVYAHHINRVARDDTGQKQTHTANYEAQAIKAMGPLITDLYRPFHFSSSGVNLKIFPTFARDTSTAMFFAAQAAKSFGFNKSDRILLSMNSDEDKSWNPDSYIYTFLRAQTIRILKLTWGSEEVPTCFLWDPPPSKQEEAEFLPIEIFKLTASCRNPSFVAREKQFFKCGKCPECITLGGVVHPHNIPEKLKTYAM